jgi:hypothetical protein
MVFEFVSGGLKKTGLALMLLVAGLLMLPNSQAFAQAATTPCDPQFMQALEARAWLEAQREITQNENLIVKPDSVLEYSCFIGFLDMAASNFTIDGVNRQFSETTAWASNGFGQTSTDQALTHVVAQALGTYIDANFPNNFLGGRLAIPGNKPNGNTMNTVNGGTPYNCATMAEVWEQARCQNFDQDSPNDGFHDFLWYQQNDPRGELGTGTTALQSCSTLTTSSMGQPTLGLAYNLALTSAFNGNAAMFVIPAGDDVDPTGGNYLKDDVNSYFNLILPTQCSNPPIPTGVNILRASELDNTTAGPDAVCPNPGCSLVGGTCQ